MPIRLSFHSAELKTLAMDEATIRVRLGLTAGRAWQTFLADVRGSANFGEVLNLYPETIPSADGWRWTAGRLTVHMSSGHVASPPPKLPDGAIDWTSVTRVAIVEVDHV